MAWVITATSCISSSRLLHLLEAQYIAGRVQEDELKRQAEQEKLAAQSRELQRRQELNRALAANMVEHGSVWTCG
jgi:hypothetical protein